MQNRQDLSLQDLSLTELLSSSVANNNIFFSNISSSYSRSSSEIFSSIDSNFQITQKITGKGVGAYIMTGSESYIYINGYISTNTTDIVSQLVENTPEGESIEVLDVGAGDYSLGAHLEKKFRGRVKAYGIVANDKCRNEKDRTPEDEFHKIGNAEYLSKQYKEKRFDCIFSRTTYTHFCDPVGAVIESYEILKPGGVLVIDSFTIRGCSNYTQKIIAFLKNSGYLVIAEPCSNGQIKNFLIQKPLNNSKPYLEFPVLCDYIERNCFNYIVYKPSRKLLVFNETTLEQENNWYEKECKIAIEKVQQINNPLFSRCSNLLELFLDEEYRSSTRQNKRLFILAVIAKTMKYDQLAALYEQYYTTLPQKTLSCDIIKDFDIISDPTRGLSKLRGFFEKIDTQLHLIVIQITAMELLLFNQRMNDSIESLKTMNLPWSGHNFNPSWEGDDLDFSSVSELYKDQELNYNC